VAALAFSYADAYGILCGPADDDEEKEETSHAQPQAYMNGSRHIIIYILIAWGEGGN
jgi:hypothetical protein